jgi:anti-sigma factor RsiW
MQDAGDDVYGLVGAYVLDALDEDERHRVEAAVAASPELAAEVASLREAAGMLAAAAVETPPEGLRAAVLARVDTVRQDRPVVPIEQAPSRRVDARPATRAWVRTLSTGVAAAVVLVAVGLGVTVGRLAGRVDQIEAQSRQVAAVVAAEDATRLAADLPDGGHLSAVFSAEQGVAVVVGDDLAAVGEQQMYALWAIVDGQPIPAGELVAGQAFTVSGAPLDAVGLTVEPRGPLSTPTGEVIALLS